METGCYTSRKAGRWNWLLHKQEVSGSWKLAATQAGKLEGGTSYYTSRKAGRWNWLLHKQEVSGRWNWLLHKQESWKVDWLLYKQESWKVDWLLHKQEVSGCLVSEYLELLL